VVQPVAAMLVSSITPIALRRDEPKIAVRKCIRVMIYLLEHNVIIK
jgi:hypothetical protein